ARRRAAAAGVRGDLRGLTLRREAEGVAVGGVLAAVELPVGEHPAGAARGAGGELLPSRPARLGPALDGVRERGGERDGEGPVEVGVGQRVGAEAGGVGEGGGGAFGRERAVAEALEERAGYERE